MNSNFHPNLQKSLSVNPWILIVAFLLPVGIGSTYFIQEHRYQTEKTEKVVLQKELSKAKDDLQNTRNQLSKDDTQIENAKQEVKNLKTQLEKTGKETQELRNNLTYADNTVKTLSTEKLAFTRCMTGVGHIVERTNPLYRRIQEDHLLSVSTLVDGSTAASAFTELHSVWDAEACQNLSESSLNSNR